MMSMGKHKKKLIKEFWLHCKKWAIAPVVMDGIHDRITHRDMSDEDVDSIDLLEGELEVFAEQALTGDPLDEVPGIAELAKDGRAKGKGHSRGRGIGKGRKGAGL
jgi:hypothetical protein